MAASRAKKIDQHEPAPPTESEDRSLEASASTAKEGTAAPAGETPKRKRDYAEEHRRRKAARGFGVVNDKPGRPTKQTKLDQLREQMTQTFVELGAGAGFFAPTGGMYFTITAERRAKNYVLAAQQYPWLMPYFEKIGPSTVIISIVADALALVIAVAVDVGRVDPYAPLAQTLRVSEAYEIAHADEREGPAQNGEAARAPQGAPDFLRVAPSEAAR